MSCPICDSFLDVGPTFAVCPKNHYGVTRVGKRQTTRVGAFLFHEYTDAQRPAHVNDLIDAAVEMARQ